MYEIYVAVRFEAAHRLVGDFGPATRTHGHTYRMEVIVRGKHLGDDGTLYDIGGLGLEGVNTTAGAVAPYCWDKPGESLRGQGLDSLTVRIWESPDGYAAREDTLACWSPHARRLHNGRGHRPQDRRLPVQRADYLRPAPERSGDRGGRGRWSIIRGAANGRPTTRLYVRPFQLRHDSGRCPRPHRGRPAPEPLAVLLSCGRTCS